MSNGAALQLVEPASIVTPSKHDPAPAQPDERIEHRIGVMVADAVAAAAQAVVDWAEAGAMTPATRTLNGEMLGRIVMLRLDSLGPNQPDFDQVALDEGRKVLLARHGATRCRRQYSATDERLVDELLRHVVYLTKTIFASELALRARN